MPTGSTTRSAVGAGICIWLAGTRSNRTGSTGPGAGRGRGSPRRNLQPLIAKAADWATRSIDSASTCHRAAIRSDFARGTAWGSRDGDGDDARLHASSDEPHAARCARAPAPVRRLPEEVAEVPGPGGTQAPVLGQVRPRGAQGARALPADQFLSTAGVVEERMRVPVAAHALPERLCPVERVVRTQDEVVPAEALPPLRSVCDLGAEAALEMDEVNP